MPGEIEKIFDKP